MSNVLMSLSAYKILNHLYHGFLQIKRSHTELSPFGLKLASLFDVSHLFLWENNTAIHDLTGFCHISCSQLFSLQEKNPKTLYGVGTR